MTGYIFKDKNIEISIYGHKCISNFININNIYDYNNINDSTRILLIDNDTDIINLDGYNIDTIILGNNYNKEISNLSNSVKILIIGNNLE